MNCDEPELKLPERMSLISVLCRFPGLENAKAERIKKLIKCITNAND